MRAKTSASQLWIHVIHFGRDRSGCTSPQHGRRRDRSHRTARTSGRDDAAHGSFRGVIRQADAAVGRGPSTRLPRIGHSAPRKPSAGSRRWRGAPFRGRAASGTPTVATGPGQTPQPLRVVRWMVGVASPTLSVQSLFLNGSVELKYVLRVLCFGRHPERQGDQAQPEQRRGLQQSRLRLERQRPVRRIDPNIGR